MANTTGKKYGGRKKGTPNKVTKDIKNAFRQLIESNIDNLSEWLNNIAKENPEKAFDLILKLSEYVTPKLNRTEYKEQTSIEDLLQLTPEQREKRINELRKKIRNNEL